jgi:hypothetical protein
MILGLASTLDLPRPREEVVLHFLRGVQADTVAESTPETAGLLERWAAGRRPS